MAIKRKQSPIAEGQLDIFSEITERSLTSEQKTFIEYDGKSSVILSAVAGSGKTFSCVERLKKLIKRGVDPSRIIFFSFTNAATEELKKRVGRDDVKITTIHAFCFHILSKTGRYKPITNFMDFIKWYKENFKPSKHAPPHEQEAFHNNIQEMYSDAEFLASKITSFKLMRADGIKSMMPQFFIEYENFQKATKARDFSDMLIEVHDMFKENKWLQMFKGKYDYIFVDEFQDTTTIQLKVLLALNAKFYYLIGDKFQSIFAYCGPNVDNLMSLLKQRREVEEMTLTMNFRSDINIVENANNYSELKAIPNSSLPGSVNFKILTQVDDLIEILDKRSEVAIIVRTNNVIMQLEKKLLSIRYPMRYMNFLSKKDMEDLKNNKRNPVLDRKIASMEPFFSSVNELIAFIKINESSKKFITTIHKSKGREFDCCVVVNSIAPDTLSENGFVLPNKEFKKISFIQDCDDREAENVHYVAVTRPKHELFFMLFGNP